MDYATNDGSAGEPGDYTDVSGTLNFTGNDGESYDITVPIIDDSLIEPTEDFTVLLDNLSTNPDRHQRRHRHGQHTGQRRRRVERHSLRRHQRHRERGRRNGHLHRQAHGQRTGGVHRGLRHQRR
ncbi:Calx-beta domain-containing protein [Allomuricauda sp. SCSIO 65647]|uniref:Calx-beta domain-containing protein n=1 Tax=Allomuricauda sp. SCSIO 65647 TaxID=2908843 RepID=UPI00391B3692